MDKQFLAYALAYLLVVLPAVATVDNFLNWEFKHGALSSSSFRELLPSEVHRSIFFSTIVAALLVASSLMLSKAFKVSSFEALILVLLTLLLQVEDLFYVVVRMELTPLNVEWEHLATYWALGKWTTISVYQTSLVGVAIILVVAANMDKLRKLLKEELDLY